ncbi:MAG: DUF885 domain-containing protein [Pseudomonadota bacterium]
MMRETLAAAAMVALVACGVSDTASVDQSVTADNAGTPGPNAAQEFAQLLDDHWALRMSENPVLAEQLGDESGRGKLSDPSLAAYEASAEARQALLARLEAIDQSALAPDDALNAQLLGVALRNAVDAAQTNGRYLTITTYAAPHLSLARLAQQARLRKPEDVASYLGRLGGMRGYMEAVTERLDEGVELGWVQPCSAMVGFERTFRTHIVDDPEQSVFFSPLKDNNVVSESDRAEALRVIEGEIIPAFQAFETFYTDRYIANCRDEVGIGSLQGGMEFYALAAKQYTTTDMTPDEIHNVGLDEVARIRAEMTEVAAEAGFSELSAYQTHLRTNPEFYPATAEERLARASTIAKRIDGQLVNLFTVLPRMPYDIRPIPLDVAEGTTTAYYSRPAPDGSRPGTYRLNTTRLATRPLHELEALTLHEAVPGHHLQIALAQELDLPNFRRFGSVTAYTEGWGLYSERLGLEVGFYQTPETNFGRLSYEMWRACRLVVDTGMHAKGWTRQEAIDFMLANTGLSANNIEREVDRYITWPGQALAYKIGELKIRELRARAEEALGRDFDVRRFHDVVLANGPVPLSVLDTIVSAWIESKQAGE